MTVGMKTIVKVPVKEAVIPRQAPVVKEKHECHNFSCKHIAAVSPSASR